MDLDAGRVARTATAARELVSHHGLDVEVLETTDRREALAGADVVIITFQVGGVESYKWDVEIPRKYGIDQAVGDTVGPGGFMRAMRTLPMIAEIGEAVKQYAPDAWVLNFTNPMTTCIRTLYTVYPGIRAMGCCHEVFGTQKLLCAMLEDMAGSSLRR
jgi:alpha-galactosidase